MRLFIFLFFISFRLHAQLAVISDPEGFVNVRQAADKQSAIRDTLHTGQVVEVADRSGNWNLINIPKAPFAQGYVHRSRLRFVHQLPNAEQQKILLAVFKDFVAYARESDKQKTVSNANSFRINDRMESAFGTFTLIWKNRPDTLVLHAVFSALRWSTGSASEQRTWLAACCALYHPELFKYVLCHENKTVQEAVVNAVNIGFEMNIRNDMFSRQQEKQVMEILRTKCPFEIRNYENLDNISNKRIRDELFALVYEGAEMDSNQTPAKLHLQPEGVAVIKGDTATISAFGYRFELSSKPFESENHVLFFDQANPKLLYAIDAAPAWGTEGDSPRPALTSMQMTYKGKTIRLDQAVTTRLYNTNHNASPSGEFHYLRVFRSADKQRVYLRMYGSDGALGYVVIWIFQNGMYIGRVVEHGF